MCETPQTLRRQEYRLISVAQSRNGGTSRVPKLIGLTAPDP